MHVDLTQLEAKKVPDFSEKKFYSDLGEILRIHRRIKNYSQEYMAIKLMISQNAYFKIESGKSKCSIYRLLNILTMIDVDFEEILIRFQIINSKKL